MKRRELIRHLERHGCFLKHEGGEHSLYQNPASREMQAVPRHTEIPDILARKICRKLSVPDPN
jgi:mRNA interferase HicA